MIAPDVELQGAIVAAVEADSELMALIGGIYDHVPPEPFGAVDTYVSFGPSTVNPQEIECIQAEEHVVQLDVWSRAIGRVACKAVCHRLKHLLSGTELPLAENGFVRGQLVLGQIVPDPKEGICHGILQIQFDLEDQT